MNQPQKGFSGPGRSGGAQDLGCWGSACELQATGSFVNFWGFRMSVGLVRIPLKTADSTENSNCQAYPKPPTLGVVSTSFPGVQVRLIALIMGREPWYRAPEQADWHTAAKSWRLQQISVASSMSALKPHASAASLSCLPRHLDPAAMRKLTRDPAIWCLKFWSSKQERRGGTQASSTRSGPTF